jgi:hypothetical protein
MEFHSFSMKWSGYGIEIQKISEVGVELIINRSFRKY